MRRTLVSLVALATFIFAQAAHFLRTLSQRRRYRCYQLRNTPATSRRRMCPPAASKRFTRSATGSWRQPGSNGRFVASKPLDGR